MIFDLLNVVGGVGLYILGMQIMTEALRQMASSRARAALSRFARTPLTGAVTGAAVTALLQSSSAVLITTIGFVGAGMLSFPQAIGIVLGANIGTTITGWMVMLIGLKLKLGLVALPGVFLGAMMRLAGPGGWDKAGRTLAGFSLVFLGFDLLQTGTAGFEGMLTPESLPADGLLGRMALLGIGFAFTLVVQSSGAGVATALVLLGGGAIALPQAAAMVIGMDVGTTVKSIIATIGGSRDMRRTAIAHVVYNLVTGTIAFVLLGPATTLLLALTAGDAPAALVAFHTGFNLLGVALLLPLTGPFARLILRLVPGGETTEPLDRALLADPDAALDAARGATNTLSSRLFDALGRRLSPNGKGDGLELLLAQMPRAIEDIEDFLTRLAVPPGAAPVMRRHSALLHQFDHLHRLSHRAELQERISLLRSEPRLTRAVTLLGAALRRAAANPADPAHAARFARIAPLITRRTTRLRRAALWREHRGLTSPGGIFHLTDALRWLDRSMHHCERILHYAVLAAQQNPPAQTRAGGEVSGP